MKRVVSLLLIASLLCAIVPTVFAEETTVTEPSAMQAGLQKRYCSRCDDVEQKTLAALSNPFTDIRETDYFYAPVLWALKNGITVGTDEGKFSPDDPCTRRQIVCFLYRALYE